MADTRYLAVDTETTGLDWWAEHRPFLATTSDQDTDYTHIIDPGHPGYDDGVERLVAQLHRATDLILFNAQFDIHMLVKSGLFSYDDLLAKGIHDVSVLARLTVPREAVNYQFRLKNIADVILGDGSSDEESELKLAMHEEGLISRPTQQNLPDGAYYDLWRLQPDLVERYAEKDTRITWELYWTLLDRLGNPELTRGEEVRREEIVAGQRRVWDLERAVQPIVTRMEARGVKLDQSRMADLTGEAEVALAQFDLNLSEFTGGDPDFDADSPKQVADLLIEAGVPLNKNDETGNYRTDKFALAEHEGHPVVAALLGHRLYAKFLSTYLRPWSGRDVLHPGIWTIGTETGRMSSARPNMQNIPTRSGPKVREALVPRDGHSLVVADYSSIELRVLAYYMQDDGFWDLVLNRDVFLWMGEEIYGTPDQDAWGVSRSSLKNGTYAILYGAGGPRIARTIGNGMTADEGRELARNIKSVLGPRYNHLQSRVKDRVRKTGSVATILGRRQQVPRDKGYVGLNYLIQGTAADIMKLGMAGVAAEARRYGAHLLLPVHDEIVTEIPTDAAHQWAEAMSAAMGAATSESTLAAWGAELKYELPVKAEAVVCHNNYSEAK